MNYTKLGGVFHPKNNHDWMYYYASQITSVELDSCIRVYFTTRSKLDENGFFQTYISFLDCDKNDPTKVLYVHDKPLLEMGLPGTFDEHGTMTADVIIHNGKYYLYYVGWQRTTNAPYLNRIGLAMSDDGVNFKRVSDGPVMGLNRFSAFGYGTICVVVEDDVFHMWYTHYNPWIKTAKGYRPTYDIRYGRSSNGLDWQFDDNISIVPFNDNEAIATPCVRKINGRYHMWYAYRPGVDEMGNSGPYSIGYAVSDNMLDWKRMDETVTIGVSPTGWDSEMVEYPDIIVTKDNVFMFYAGNNYGRDGFGCAKIENI